MYNVYSFLEPLGLISAIPIPTAPQDTASDPWANSFPVEKQTYRLHDDDDGTDRCPSCLHEIWNNSCARCDAEFSGSDEDDGFDVDTIEFDIDNLSADGGVGSESESDGELGIARPIRIAEDGEDDQGAGRPRRGRGARVNIRNLQDILGESEDDTPARARIQTAILRNMYDMEASDDEDSMGTGSESGSESGQEDEEGDGDSVGSMDFARPRPRRARRDQDRDEAPERRPRNFIDLTTGEVGGAGAPGTAQYQQRQRRRAERARQRHSGGEPMSDETDFSDDNVDDSEGAGTVYDSQEDDGAVPRARDRPRRIFTGDLAPGFDPEDYEDDEEDEESEYGGSFIDDEVEEDDVASNDEEEDADEVIQLVSGGEEEEEEEEDGAGQTPNLQDMRRKRLEALVNNRRYVFPGVKMRLY